MADIIQAENEEYDPSICPVVDIPWDHYRTCWKPWRRALVLKVLSKSISFRVLQDRILRVWKLEMGCELVDIDKGYIVARFYTQEDYYRVLNGGPWMVMGNYITITKWRPNFSPSEHVLTRTLVWVRFTALPLEMFEEKTLMWMGNSVGKAIKVDICTNDVVCGKYAKVCVEVDLDKPLKPNVMVYGRRYAVEYEGLMKICFRCGQFGHRAEACPRNRSQQEDGDTSETRSQPAPPQQSTNATPYGPWMMPAHIRRRQEQMQKRMQHRARISNANRVLNARIDQQSGSGRNGPSAKGGQTRGTDRPSGRLEEQVEQPPMSSFDKTAPVSAKGLTQSKSKFAILSELEDVDDDMNSIEALKRRIKEVPGPSTSHGLPHEKHSGRAGKAKQSGPSMQSNPGGSTRDGGPKLTIGKKKDSSSGRGRSGPLSVIAESTLNSMHLVGGPSGTKAHKAQPKTGLPQPGKAPSGLSSSPSAKNRDGDMDLDPQPSPPIDFEAAKPLDPVNVDAPSGSRAEESPMEVTPSTSN